jgi:ParB family transcriptional regulator, chromosome partitioning protein
MAKESNIAAAVAASLDATTVASNTLQNGQDIEISLGNLFISPNNVRGKKRTRIPELAATIRAHGLLQRLQVSRETLEGKPTGRFGVEAGGRRLLALQYLANKKMIADDALIPCRQVGGAVAVAISLAENAGQEPMHPADEFAAFHRLIEDGQSIEQVAKDFGQTVVQVKRRLKMAAVAPALLKIYRDGKMTLEQLMVLASVDDHARQLSVWEQCGHWSNAAQLKRRLCEDEVESDDPRVLLVGLDAYKASGGTVRTDLFSENEVFYLENPELLQAMLGEHMEQCLVPVRAEGWGWVEAVETLDYSARHSFKNLPKRFRDPTKTEVKWIARLEVAKEKARAALHALDDDDDSYDDLYAAMDAAKEALESARDALVMHTDEDKRYAGAIAHIEHGKVVILRGLVREEDYKRFQKDNPPAGGGEPDDSVVDGAAKVPERLMQDLTSHSTAAMQVAMIDNQKVALAALAATMAQKAFNLYSDTVLKVSVSLNRGDMEKNSPSIGTSSAALRLDAERQAWIDRLPKDESMWRSWFLEQSPEVVLSMLVYAAAVSVQCINRAIANKGKEAELAVALSLNMSQWWQATPATYLELVPKAKMIEAVTEAKDAVTANKMLKMKKAEAVAYAAQELHGTDWLPPILRIATR